MQNDPKGDRPEGFRWITAIVLSVAIGVGVYFAMIALFSR